MAALGNSKESAIGGSRGAVGGTVGVDNKCWRSTTFASINIQGLLSEGKQKKEELLQFARLENVGVLAVQETWLSKSHKLPESQLESYKEIWSVRPTRKRGGSSIYISHEFTVLKQETFSNEHCGVAMARLKVLNCQCLSLYRPPGAPVESFVEMVQKIRS